jgi:hypothetical protein
MHFLSGELIVVTFGEIGIDPKLLLSSIEGSSYQLSASLKAVFSHSLAQLVLLSILGNHARFDYRFDFGIDRRFVRTFFFSFAESFPLVSSEARGHFVLSIADRAHVSTPEIILLESAAGNLFQESESAFASAKTALILLSLQKSLRGSGIETDELHFVVDPFERATFRLSRSSFWRLSLFTPRLRLYGRSVSLRFVDCLLHLVGHLSLFARLSSQAPFGTFPVETDLDTRLCFRVSPPHSFCTSLSVSLGSLSLLPLGSSHFSVQSPPALEFSFGRHIGLTPFLRDLADSGSPGCAFASFLRGSLVPLQQLSSVFAFTPSWAISPLQEDRSFFLTYGRAHTVNLMLKPSQHFQVIVPSIGASALFQVPLEALSRFRAGAQTSHTTLRVHASRVCELRDAVERFFAMTGMLERIGFRHFAFEGGDLTCSFPG